MTPFISNRKNSGTIQQVNHYRNTFYWPLKTRGTILLVLLAAVIIAVSIIIAAWIGRSDISKVQKKEKYEILTGPRGGRYYINRNGNKTYVKREERK